MTVWAEATMRQKRPRKRAEPSTPASDHSRSRSGGAAKRMNRRQVSAPYFACMSSGLTVLPLLFDIFEPPKVTIPWVSRRVKGSSMWTRPMSRRALVKKRE